MSRRIRADYEQGYLLPRCIEDWVGPDHPARFVRDLVDSLDLRTLGFNWDQDPGTRGRPGYAADLLLKVWVWGYFSRIRSTRKLEWECRNGMGAIWLTGDHAPDHNTLWRFWDRNRPAIKRLFGTVVRVAVDAGLVGLALQAVDGTKIQAAASRRTGWYKRTLTRKLKDLDALIASAMAEVESTEQAERGLAGPGLPKALADSQARREAIAASLAKLAEAGETNLHPKDPESRVMKCGSTLAFAYNAQMVVESETGLVVASEVVTDESDNAQLVPMVEAAHETVGQASEQTLADGGYYAPEQVADAEEKAYGVLLKLGERPSASAAPLHKAQFRYDAQTDTCVCPAGQRLTFKRERWNRRKTYQLREYRCSSYKRCPHRSACCKGKGGRTVERHPYEAEVSRQRDRQKAPAKRAILKRRSELAEIVFARIKQHEGFRRWTVRGLQKVRAQWAMLCLTFDLKRLYPLWKSGEFTWQ